MPRLNQQADFYELPEIATGYRLPPYFSLVIPVNRDVTNLVANPSGELNVSGWTDTSGAVQAVQSTTYQYHGVYSLRTATEATVANPGLMYQSVSLSASTLYVLSTKFICPIGGITFRLEFLNTSNVVLAYTEFKSTGFWQWVWVRYLSSSSITAYLHIEQITFPSSSPLFYVDGVQVEEIPSGSPSVPTTYIDGSQVGLTPGEFPLPYYWNGTPHASTSVRSSATRSGGRVVNLLDLGLTISAIAGLALPVPQGVSLPFGQLDGEQYIRTRKEAREFTIAGRVTGRSAVQLDQLFGSLSREFDRDSFSRDEPMILKYQPLDEQDQVIGPELDMVVTYQGGLEGQRNNLNTEVFTATFKQYLPSLLSHSDGATLTNSATVTNANSAIRRKSDGTWAAVSTGFTGGLARITALARHPDGTIYWGGDFTDAGGSGADYAAKYNPTTDVLSVVKAATSFNAAVEVITVGPDGRVYFGGSFTNVDGIANADGIVVYDPVANTFAALGTGVAVGGFVFAIIFDSAGNMYAGGSFTLMGGVANTVNIAKWNGSAWSAVGTGTNGLVRTILPVGTTDVYIGGDFTLAGGVANTIRIAKWNGSAYTAMGTGANNAVRHIVKSPSGLLYVVGVFTTLDGRSIEFIGTWNGVTFAAVGSGTTFSDSIQGIAFKPNGTFFVVGEFGTVNGVPFPDAIAEFDGSDFTSLGVDTPGGGAIFDIIVAPDGAIYIGYNAAGSASVESITTVTNDGTAYTYPIITIKGPSSGSSRIFSIRNLTTGKGLFIYYTILAGETAIMNTDPKNSSFVSNFFGDVSYTILPGSDSNFYLARGSNRIAMINTGSPTVEMYWSEAFLSAFDAVGVI